MTLVNTETGEIVEPSTVTYARLTPERAAAHIVAGRVVERVAS